MLGKHRIGLPINRIPELSFRKLTGSPAFGEQGIQFFCCALKAGHGTLFDGRQCCVHYFLDRVIGTALNNSFDPAFLFWGEMDGHDLLLLTSSPSAYEKTYRYANIRGTDQDLGSPLASC
jgi:hypothetical protein